MTTYKIVHKTKPALFACGFYSLKRAEEWLAAYDPKHYVDKTVKASDLEIVPEGKPR